MNVQIDPLIERRILTATDLGNPFALDDFLAAACNDDVDRSALTEIVADEYRRRLAAMPRKQMLELYRQFYEDANDANKDWLLGETVESIDAERN